MQEYRVICKSDQGFLNAVLAASYEDTMLEIDESRRELIIPEFEAYRTGIPEIRKILKANDVLLRSQYFDYDDYALALKGNISLMSTGTLGNLKKIDTAYQKGAYLNAYIFVVRGNRIYLCSNFKIVFLGPDRVPTLRYKPTCTNHPPIDMKVWELIEIHQGMTNYFGTEAALLDELKVMYRLLPKLVKYSH